jgi:hypothetical protein
MALNRKENVMSRFVFLHAPSGESWEVADPIQWCLEHARQPLLERARKGLLGLTPLDRTRIIRLVTRRCKLNLIEFLPERLVVHHWGKEGKADLRPCFKRHALAKQSVEVFLIDRKREVITVQPGDDFLYGARLPKDWPWELYLHKWRRRESKEPDDWTPAPGSWSSFCWTEIEPGLVPWAVLKSMWLRETAPLCLNCDKPPILVGFGRVQCGMFNWRDRFVRFCPECQRLFEDGCPSDLGKWVVANLDEPLLPGFQRVWGKVVKWKPASGQVEGNHE